ncbi:SulP family inorganic anion transporter [Candidatus Ruthia endofausta]|uniref:SulP family inorganic anion transporter n=1 Tax=Candidatus Ruthia endofausta TaxID=2738852 RepID=UPI001FE29D0B|nr:SulP family inorganic anion transporter [Candidatus Ruthia endofausta]
MVNFVSHTVIIGFTIGATILIASSQLKHITGIFVPKSKSFIHTLIDLYQGAGDANMYLIIIALVTFNYNYFDQKNLFKIV